MLIEFNVENFRSFRERVSLSMIAAKLRASDERLDHDNVIVVNEKLSLLRSATIYGANASGKSNLIKAFKFMRRFVIRSAGSQEEDAISIDPFLLDTHSPNDPSSFEAVFLMNGLQYRYGFTLTSKRVMSEWLYFTPTSREVELFTRVEDDINITPRFGEGRRIKGLRLDNKLFLSAIAQLDKNSTLAKQVQEWFKTNCATLTADNDSRYLPYTMDCIENDRYREKLTQLVCRLDLNIEGLRVAEVPMPSELVPIQDMLDAMKPGVQAGGMAKISAPSQRGERTMKELQTKHIIRDKSGRAVERREFSAQEMESEGTQKLIALAGPLLDVLSNGWVLFLDEIDSRLHPLITAAILRLFNSPETNPKNAQLICTTHDTNLLDRRLFRRDQIYFVEKDQQAVSHLYSLAAFKLEHPQGHEHSVRNDASFEKNYIQGRYGAIPYMGDLRSLFLEERERQESSKTDTDLGASVK